MATTGEEPSPRKRATTEPARTKLQRANEAARLAGNIIKIVYYIWKM